MCINNIKLFNFNRSSSTVSSFGRFDSFGDFSFSNISRLDYNRIIRLSEEVFSFSQFLPTNSRRGFVFISITFPVEKFLIDNFPHFVAVAQLQDKQLKFDYHSKLQLPLWVFWKICPDLKCLRFRDKSLGSETLFWVMFPIWSHYCTNFRYIQTRSSRMCLRYVPEDTCQIWRLQAI